MTIGYGGLKKGMPIELDGEPYVVVDYERSKKEQRAPVARIRFKSLRNGKVLDKSFNGFDVKFNIDADLTNKNQNSNIYINKLF